MFDDPPPWRTHSIAVPHGHVLHVQESGARDGPAALVLHGGPGSGASPLLRRFLDPRHWRIVCPDQRGAGRSTLRGATAHNGTAELLADLRRLRQALGIDRWVVVGGSWGATLALAHALDAPDAVAALLLRAVFVPRADTIAAFFAGRDGLPALDWRRIDDADPTVQRATALDWWRREQRLGAASTPDRAPSQPAGTQTGPAAGTGGTALPEGPALDALLDRYRVQAHYLRHRCWLDAPPLAGRMAALPRVPTLLLHSSDDRVCPPAEARALHAAMPPHARLRWVDGAGHDPAHPAMAAAMVRALQCLAQHGAFDAGTDARAGAALRAAHPAGAAR